jgi:hypothetical protein
MSHRSAAQKKVWLSLVGHGNLAGDRVICQQSPDSSVVGRSGEVESKFHLITLSTTAPATPHHPVDSGHAG